MQICQSATQIWHILFGFTCTRAPPRLTSDSDLISMCQRCSSSLCRFSTAFCFCFFSLLSCSFLARLLGLISTGSSGFTFFYRGTENMWWTCSRLLCLFADYPTAFFFPFQVSITDLNLRLERLHLEPDFIQIHLKMILIWFHTSALSL